MNEMVDKTRAKLRPRKGRNLDTAIETRASGITAQDIADPGSPPVAESEPTPVVESVVEPTIEPEPTADPVPEPVEETKSADMDDWVNSLTVPTQETEPTPVEQTYQSAEYDIPTEIPNNSIDLDAAAEARRLERLRGMSTIDEEVAREIYDNVLKPELDEMRASYDERVNAISGTLSDQQRRQEEYDQSRVARQRAKTNDVILEKHPHAGKILQSTEFMAFLKTKEDPYAGQSKYDILNRAYSAGDAEYVLRELDAFAETRRKPKPQASVDVNSGGAPNTSGSNTRQPMSEQQYLAKRKQIMSRRHNPGDLTKLYNQYTASQQ